MSAIKPEAGVLIVGGGPTGLAAAVELGLRGVDCLLVEPRTEVSPLRPRAKTTSVRTMEHFRRWGLASTVRAAASLPVAWSQDVVFCTAATGTEITRFRGSFGLTPERVDWYPESGQQIPQPAVERVLRAAVADLPAVQCAYGYQVTALHEPAGAQGGLVRATLAAADGTPHHVRARYAVGCDGGGGITRTAIGAAYAGSSDSRRNVNLVFRAPALASRIPHGPAVHYWVVGQQTSGVLGPMDLDGMWWASIAGYEGPLDPTVLAGMVHTLIGAAGIEVSVESTDTWTAHSLLADRYASAGGRIFLAGDTAHLNPPWGGHGFNTGIGDAVNIGWKLAAVLAGWAGPGLLASYELERRPVAARTIDAAALHLRRTPADLAALVAAMSAGGAAGQAARVAAAEAIQAGKDPEFHSLGLVLGYEYGGGGGPGDVAHYRPSARPGARLPHAWLPDGTSLYDRLGPGYTLLRLGPGDPAPLTRAAAARGLPLALVDLRGILPAAAYGAPLVLVRPDQHVAWRGDDAPGSADGVIDLARGHAPARAPLPG